MKKTNNIILIAVVGCILSASCKKVLDKQDLGNFTVDQVYNDSAVAKLTMDYLYSQNQPGWFGNSGGALGGTLSTICDEQYGDNAYVKGTVTIETVGDIGAQATQGNYFKIRQLNMFIQSMNAGTLAPDVKKRFIGQAFFWRGYRYFELVKLYGGVPLTLTPLPAVGAEAKAAANLPRNTTTETFQQIINDLDSAAAYCPTLWGNNADYGRITSGAALAMLGRVLVTWASPQWNPNGDQSRWQMAYDVNTQAIATLSANGFGLYPKWDYTMWKTEGSAGGSKPQNIEAVLVTEYNTGTADITQNNETYTNGCWPKAFGGGGSNTPSWELAQSFPMKDGKDTLTSSYGYSLQTFYKNRDPRFYETIAYNGSLWPLNGNSNYRSWTYYYPNNKSNPSKTVTTEIGGASGSGFYLRKGLDQSYTQASVLNAGTDWIEIRYAEVLLNQAEAAAEIGHLGVADEAYANLVAIRKRAGIDAGSDHLYGLASGMNHDAMINAILFERKIEFAFEGKRYWDLRRRKLLESTLNGIERRGIVVTLKDNGSYKDYITGTRDNDAAANLDNVYSNFTVTTQTLDTYNLNVQSADYYFGIPTASLQNNVNLLQNNTWSGPFDPLK